MKIDLTENDCFNPNLLIKFSLINMIRNYHTLNSNLLLFIKIQHPSAILIQN